MDGCRGLPVLVGGEWIAMRRVVVVGILLVMMGFLLLAIFVLDVLRNLLLLFVFITFAKNVLNLMGVGLLLRRRRKRKILRIKIAHSVRRISKGYLIFLPSLKLRKRRF